MAMHDPEDPKRDKPDAPAAQGEPSATRKPSGRVTFDSRGNSVWEWQLETGVYSRDVSTQKLKKLDLGDLSIAETAIQPGPLAPKRTTPGGGFNPYDNAPGPKEGHNPYDNARNMSRPFAPQAEPKVKRHSLDDLRKLSEMIKAQRKFKKQGD
jgi:hypothetical protein